MINKPKKLGRPVGSKNKSPAPKQVSKKEVKPIPVTLNQIEMAEKLGVSKEKYVDAIMEANFIRSKLDWERLAKQLQQSLLSQFKDQKDLEDRLALLEKEAKENADSHRRYLTVISYLEIKLGLNSV